MIDHRAQLQRTYRLNPSLRPQINAQLRVCGATLDTVEEGDAQEILAGIEEAMLDEFAIDYTIDWLNSERRS